MSRILVIGDIHGKTIWKNIITKEDITTLTKIIFLGDYVDTHGNETIDQQLSNLDDILQFKEENADKVVLLRGNHCYRYGFPVGRESSGYSIETMTRFPKERYQTNTQWVHILGNTIFSHAGISQEWLEYAKIENLEDINTQDYTKFQFNGGFGDLYGTDPQQGPMWIRPDTLIDVAVQGYDQIVGHTPVEHIGVVNTTHNDKIVLCDNLANGEYLIIDNGEFHPKHL